jgi:tetratricopeptide (TPR) repeat protein
MIARRCVLFGMVLVAVVALLSACSGPEQKKTKFFSKGKALYEKGEYVKARLEFKNAVQIDPKFAEGYHLLGMVNLKTGDMNGAYGNFSKAVSLNPKIWDAQVQLGGLLLGSGKTDEALEKADLVLKGDPKHEDAHILKGGALIAKKETDAALRFLRNAVGSSVRKPDGYLMQNLAYLQKGDATGAEKSLREGIKANEKSVSLYIALVDLALKKKQIGEAIALTRKIIEIEPGVVRHRLVLAGMLWDSGKEPEAAEILKAVVAAEPKSEERWVQVATFYLSKNKAVDAERELREGIRINQQSFRIRFALADLLVATKQSDKAIATLQECLGLEKDSANREIIQSKNAIAQLHFARREVDKTKGYVEEVLKASPKNVDANFLKGKIHLQRRESIQAVSAFRVVVGEKPQFVQGYLGLADAHLISNEPKMALDTLQNALKTIPDSRDIIRAMARLYAAQKDFKNAEVQQRKILDANPNDLEVRADMGDVFQAAGDFPRAEKEFGEIVRRDSKLPLGYIKLSACFRAQKKWDKAMAELDRILQIHPNLSGAANDLAFLLADYGKDRKDIERALTLARKAQSLNPTNPSMLDTLGWVHYRLGDMKQAVEWLAKAQAGLPKNPVVNYHLGMAHHKAGNAEKAKEYLQMAMDSKADFPGRAEIPKILGK